MLDRRRLLQRILAAAFLLPLARAAPAAPPATGEWRLVAVTPSGRVAVEPRTGRTHRLARLAPGDVLSPDGTRVAYVEMVEAAGHRFPALFVSPISAEGIKTDPRKISFAGSEARPREPRWMPDSKHVVYVRGSGDYAQVYLTDSTAEKLSERRVSGGGRASRQPRVGPEGRIAYLRESSREGKLVLVDLVVKRDREHVPVVRDAAIGDYAWSPDGARIAYGVVDAVHVLDLRSGEERVIAHETVSERLHAHRATSLAWRPDGGLIAARLEFVGGRVAEPGRPARVFGDEQIFLLPADGAPSWTKAPRGTSRLEWWPSEEPSR